MVFGSRAVGAVLAIAVLVGCGARTSPAQRDASARLAAAVADRMPSLMDEYATSELAPHQWLAELPPVDGVDFAGVYDGASTSVADPETGEEVVGVDLAVGVTFTGIRGTHCVVLAATSSGRSDAALAAATSLGECENPPGRLGRADFASATDLLARDGIVVSP